MSNSDAHDDMNAIAVIGLACRFPGANGVAQFWQNLRDAVEAITPFSDEELIASGIDPETVSNPNYVKSGFVLDDIESFDAQFFGFNPKEAALLDPQHRLMLECAWNALESAGYDPERFAGRVGLYAGASLSNYYFNILSNRESLGAGNAMQFLILHGNDKDHLSTRVSYKLNLRGPSITVQTACSTSLVAVAMACQSLLNYQCDMALAGGVSLRVPQRAGYFYQDEGVHSPDGHCRAFDAGAQGTIFGNGAGVVVLKRLAEAQAEGDCIHAIIRGAAVNNDGSAKIGYTAPSVDGQAEVIAEALAMAGVEADSISYVEAHGTATHLGDPIEIEALTQAFRSSTDAKSFCGIGSVKTNIGHLGAAAGVAGLIKTVLALRHKMLPPSLYFERPNPDIDFANSPFYVNNSLRDWKSNGHPRRAGVSSFGIGGTNAHVVLQEAPAPAPSEASRPWQLILLSAKTETALEQATSNLAEHLRQHTEAHLPDVAFTLQVGRKSMAHRRVLVCKDVDDAIGTLDALDSKRVFTRLEEAKNQPVVFMFPGGGAQYVGMGAELYNAEPAFRDQIDLCSNLLKPHLGFDLKDFLYPREAFMEEASRRIRQTSVALPALFVTEYAIARLWMSWGIHPQAMIGHSLGEYVAACLAGVMSLEDALRLVAARGKLFERLPKGAMLSVPLPEDQVRELLGSELSLAAVNSPSLCLLSGATSAIDEVADQLARKGLEFRRLQIEAAGHSQMVEPILAELTELTRTLRLHPPKLPYISNVTGTWITAEQATDPAYWAKHLRQTVRFAEGVGELLKEPGRILLEVGPGQTLSTLARQHPDKAAHQAVLSSLRHPQDAQPDLFFLLNTLGRLWMAGAQVDWSAFYAGERRNRVTLPTYPFERRRYWIERQKLSDAKSSLSSLHKKADMADWFYVPSWKRRALPRQAEAALSHEDGCCLIFADACAVGMRLAKRLRQNGQYVIEIIAGERFEEIDERSYMLDPRQKDDYVKLIDSVCQSGRIPEKIIHLWGVTPSHNQTDEAGFFKASQTSGYYSLLFLAQALGMRNLLTPMQLEVVTSDVQEVTGEEPLCPEKATLLAACKVIPQEYPNISCRSIDIVLPVSGGLPEGELIDRLIAEMAAKPSSPEIAYRGNHRWERSFEPVRLDDRATVPAPIREGGVYLITGGLGGVGLLLAEHLARTAKAKLALTSRSAFLQRSEWEQWLMAHDEQDPVSRKIRKLQAIEECGSEVLILSADVADELAMREALVTVSERLGELNGVIHAAGIVRENSKSSIQEMDTAHCESHFRPKAYGLLVLEKVLQGHDLDFCVLLSSLASVLGGIGFYGYSAANLFMDAFAAKHNQSSAQSWVSVSYDGWRLKEAAEQSSGLGLSMMQLAMTPAEGVETFVRILSSGLAPQVAVSTGSLQARIDKWIKLESLRDTETSTAADPSSLHQRPELQSAYVAPTNEIEQAIAAIWQQLLGIEQVGIRDNFFELGGHSLLAIQLISRLREAFQMELSLRNLFEKPTVADLAAGVESTRRTKQRPQAPQALKRVSREGDLPLSFAQQRLWIIDQIEPGSPVYNNPKAIRLKGPLNVAAFEQALNEVIRRHEALRTTFAKVDGKPVQVIQNDMPLSLPVEDLTDLAEAEREAETQRLATEWSRLPFDLQRGPVMRAKLVRLNHQDHVLLLTLHHIVSDAWSMSVFTREVSVLYESFCDGKPAPLPEIPIQYADYAVWQREWLQGDVLEELLSYWKQKLANLPVLELPAARPRPPLQTYAGATRGFELSKDLTERVKALNSEHDVTLFMTMLAVFQTLLYRYSGQDDIAVGTDFANRTMAETESLIGFFINQLVLRTDLSGAPTFKELLARVREVTLEAYAHQDLPFEKVVEALNPERDMSRTPLVQVKIVLLNAPTTALEIKGLELSPQEFRSGIARFDLTLFITDSEQGLLGALQYNADLFDPATIDRMISHFQTLLESCVSNPDARLDSLEMLTEAERRQQMIEQQKREESKLSRFKSVKRQAVSLPAREMVKMGLLSADERLPLVIGPDGDGIDLPTWAGDNRDFIEAKLLEHGALLFRGFAVHSAPEFERFAQALCKDLFNENGEHPRTSVSGKVYTPVFYPPDERLLWHNENSFNHQWPRKIWFGCMKPAERGGETPVVDSRKVFARLSAKIKEPFIEKGIMYVRNYGDGLGLDWQTVFQTSDPAQVEAACRRALMQCDWKAGNRLRTRSIRPAVAKHPKTGEMVWFNQAQHWHVACLQPQVREALLSSFEPEDLPRHCYYGDGSPIEDAVMEEILETYASLEVSFPWRQGDLLMLDNLLTAHGRNPFAGERKLVVAMGEMCSYADI